ncbi:MAG: phage baseplate assembly protein V, partial [Waterburya sp.]
SYGLEWFGRYYGTYVGIIASNDDPKNLGRLQLQVPAVYGNKIYKYWAVPKGLFSGKGIGSFFIPNKGDKVWVSFENGDCRFPIWEYGGWSEGQVPANAKVLVKIIKTNTNTIELNDENGKERLSLKDNSENEVILDKKGSSIVSKNISLGAYKKSAEPGVLGKTAKEELEKICAEMSSLAEEVSKITVSTPLGNSSVPVNSPAILIIKGKIEAIKASLSKILSKVVTLD